MDIRLAAIGLGTGLATLCGGAFALRARGHMGLLAGVGAGALVAVALVDLLPEAHALAPGVSLLRLTSLTAAGFMSYLALGATIDRTGEARTGWTRHLGPACLVLHSLLDGFGIGAAFAASAAAGLVVGAAVLAHDLLDGANTVTLGLSARLSAAVARRWLVLDALAPLAGLALAQTARPSPGILTPLLAFFAGAFLYIGAADLLPRARKETRWAIGLALLGAAFVAGVVRLIGG